MHRAYYSFMGGRVVCPQVMQSSMAVAAAMHGQISAASADTIGIASEARALSLVL